MSFVSAVVHEKFITVMSDGLAVTTYNDGREERNEGYQKYHYIGPKQFIAFAGRVEACERLVAEYPRIPDGYDLEQVALELKEKVKEYSFESGIRILMIVGGVFNGETVMYSFTNEINEESKTFKPKGNMMEYAILQSPNITQNIHSALKPFLLEARSPEQILQIQERFNSLVSAIDPSVNTVTFKEVIYL